MTIDQGEHMERYQGIVALDGEGLEAAARHYFLQSEQIPTEVRLAVAEHATRGDRRALAGCRHAGRSTCPRTAGATCPTCRATAISPIPGRADPHYAEPDGWTEAKALLATLGDAELVDPDMFAGTPLLPALSRGAAAALRAAPLEERCTCSAERIEDMLTN